MSGELINFQLNAIKHDFENMDMNENNNNFEEKKIDDIVKKTLGKKEKIRQLNIPDRQEIVLCRTDALTLIHNAAVDGKIQPHKNFAPGPGEKCYLVKTGAIAVEGGYMIDEPQFLISSAGKVYFTPKTENKIELAAQSATSKHSMLEIVNNPIQGSKKPGQTHEEKS